MRVQSTTGNNTIRECYSIPSFSLMYAAVVVVHVVYSIFRSTCTAVDMVPVSVLSTVLYAYLRNVNNRVIDSFVANQHTLPQQALIFIQSASH